MEPRHKYTKGINTRKRLPQNIYTFFLRLDLEVPPVGCTFGIWFHHNQPLSTMGVQIVFVRFMGQLLGLQCEALPSDMEGVERWRVRKCKQNQLSDGRTPVVIDAPKNSTDIVLYIPPLLPAQRQCNPATIVRVDASTFYGRCALSAIAEGKMAEAMQWAASVERTGKPGPMVQNGEGRVIAQ